jgi:hypothetical protein
MLNVPIDELSIRFVRKSTFTARYIVHPQGPPDGGAAKFVCESCGAEYPYGAHPTPCAFCAAPKKSGVGVLWRGKIREWLWKAE